MSKERTEQDYYLLFTAEKGLREKGLSSRSEYKTRLHTEWDIISEMGFSDYYLVVQDFIGWARSQEISVGPGRGSGAGSLIAFLVGITDVDPIHYGLVFERFLNPGRVSMPDFDIDFCMKRRHEIVKYVQNKYGYDQVVQIGTKGTMKAKLAVRDTARCLGMDPETVDRYGKLIPDEARGGQGSHKVTLLKCLNPDRAFRDSHLDALAIFEKTYDTDLNFQDCVNRASEIEGRPKSIGVHAAGIIIWDQPITSLVPLLRTKDGGLATQWVDKEVEQLGLVKYDFLGLRTLTVLQEAEESILRRTSLDIDWKTIPEKDPKTYRLLASGDCLGVFQLSDHGISSFTQSFKPQSIEEISIISALYRPGPLDNGMVSAILKVRSGEVTPEYPIPEIEHILEPTQGVLTYQEQVLEIARVMAGYSLSEADLLRRAIGKKIPEEMELNRVKFIEGAVELGHSEKVSSNMYNMIEKFADYAFNKSHSIAYSILSFRTAYLKAHYLSDFYSACLSSYEDQERLKPFLAAAKKSGIKVLLPDVNLSHVNFTATDEVTILFGLGAIRGCGIATVSDILEKRKDGKFLNLIDFCSRINPNAVRSNNVEALAMAGAFDRFEPKLNRLEIVKYAASVVAAVKSDQKTLRKDQTNFLETLFESETKGIEIERPSVKYNQSKILEYERTLLGFFISGHPLEKYTSLRGERNFDEVASLEVPDLSVTVLGIIKNFLVRRTKKNTEFGIFDLEDETGTIPCKIWSNKINLFRESLVDGNSVILRGKTNFYRGMQISTDSIILADVENSHIKIKYILKTLASDQIFLLSSLARGRIPVDLEVPGFRYRLGSFSIDESLSKQLSKLGALKEVL